SCVVVMRKSSISAGIMQSCTNGRSAVLPARVRRLRLCLAGQRLDAGQTPPALLLGHAGGGDHAPARAGPRLALLVVGGQQLRDGGYGALLFQRHDQELLSRQLLERGETDALGRLLLRIDLLEDGETTLVEGSLWTKDINQGAQCRFDRRTLLDSPLEF